jgi:hypothetical protein
VHAVAVKKSGTTLVSHGSSYNRLDVNVRPHSSFLAVNNGVTETSRTVGGFRILRIVRGFRMGTRVLEQWETPDLPILGFLNGQFRQRAPPHSGSPKETPRENKSTVDERSWWDSFHSSRQAAVSSLNGCLCNALQRLPPVFIGFGIFLTAHCQQHFLPPRRL